MKGGRLVILLIDDDENDIVLFQLATQRGGAGHTVHSVQNAKEAISYLRGEGPYVDRLKFPLPNVIMADLKMPGMSGLDFLRWLRSHPECSIIPTLIFSSSSIKEDVRAAYEMGANSFLSKPADLDSLIELLRALYNYWSRCECPPMPGGF